MHENNVTIKYSVAKAEFTETKHPKMASQYLYCQNKCSYSYYINRVTEAENRHVHGFHFDVAYML